MAEGDSIARLAARLHGQLTAATVVRSDIRHPRFAGADPAGQTVTGWHPRGKHLLMRTDAGWTVHSHLRMSGSWSVLRAGRRLPAAVAADLRIALHLGDAGWRAWGTCGPRRSCSCAGPARGARSARSTCPRCQPG